MRPERYNAKEAEPQWQQAWDERDLFETDNDDPRPKYYVLEMFPYPSGRIHMGHVRNYAMGDVVARYKRAKGFNVLHPMGWDAFGLPAENAAMREQGPPAGVDLRQHRHHARRSCKSMGLSLDWSREIATCDPELLQAPAAAVPRLPRSRAGRPQDGQGQLGSGRPDRARQRAGDRRPRLALGRAGRAARADPVVLQDHRLSRRSCSTALDTLDRWPEKVRLMQRNWIGRSEGLLVRFALDPATAPNGETRARGLHDPARHAVRRHLHGDRARSSAGEGGGREQPGARRPSSTNAARMGTAAAAIETAEKKGFDTGIRVVHPFDPAWTLPVYVANFVLMDYGTGAIFGCPAHDQRDLDFARKYGLAGHPGGLPAGRGPGDLRRSSTRPMTATAR